MRCLGEVSATQCERVRETPTPECVEELVNLEHLHVRCVCDHGFRWRVCETEESVGGSVRGASRLKDSFM